MDHLSPLFQQLMMSFSNAFLYRPTVRTPDLTKSQWIKTKQKQEAMVSAIS